MIEGCLQWQRDGLIASASIAEATEDYFDEQDLIRSFLNEKCEVDLTELVREI